MQLWEHQARGLTQIREAITKGYKRICVVSPTGSGKGTEAAEVLRLVIARGGKGIFIVHRREIILDQKKRLEAHGLNVGVIMPGQAARPYADVQACSAQTLIARASVRPEATVILVDECHHYVKDNTWTEILDAYPNAIIIGLTATPERQDGRPLGDIFEVLIVLAQYSELIAAGKIVPCRVYVPARDLETDAIAASPVVAYQTHTPGMKGFVFVKSVAYGHQLAAEFNAADIAAEVIHAKTKKRVRDEALERLRDGKTKLLINCMALSEGVDCADAQVCILVRNPKHVGGFLQMAGRVLRSAFGKEYAVLLDLFGCCKRLGLPTDDREYSLDGKDGGISTGSAVKQCPGCDAFIPNTAKVCPHCSHEFITGENGKSIAPTDAGVGLVDVAQSIAEDRARLEPMFIATVKNALDTGAPLIWALSEFKSEHCKEGIPRPLLSLIGMDTRKRAYDEAQGGMIRAALRPGGRLKKEGFGQAVYKDVFGSWPLREWVAAHKAEYARVAQVLNAGK